VLEITTAGLAVKTVGSAANKVADGTALGEATPSTDGVRDSFAGSEVCTEASSTVGLFSIDGVAESNALAAPDSAPGAAAAGKAASAIELVAQRDAGSAIGVERSTVGSGVAALDDGAMGLMAAGTGMLIVVGGWARWICVAVKLSSNGTRVQGNKGAGAAASAPISTALGTGMSNICIDARASASWLDGSVDETKLGVGSAPSAIIGVAVVALTACMGNLFLFNFDRRPRRECTCSFGFRLIAAAHGAGAPAICIGIGAVASASSNRPGAIDETGLGAAASASLVVVLGACGAKRSARSISAGAIEETGLGYVASEIVVAPRAMGASAICIATGAIGETGLAALRAGALASCISAGEKDETGLAALDSGGPASSIGAGGIDTSGFEAHSANGIGANEINEIGLGTLDRGVSASCVGTGASTSWMSIEETGSVAFLAAAVGSASEISIDVGSSVGWIIPRAIGEKGP